MENGVEAGDTVECFGCKFESGHVAGDECGFGTARCRHADLCARDVVADDGGAAVEKHLRNGDSGTTAEFENVRMGACILKYFVGISLTRRFLAVGPVEIPDVFVVNLLRNSMSFFGGHIPVGKVIVGLLVDLLRVVHD